MKTKNNYYAHSALKYIQLPENIHTHPTGSRWKLHWVGCGGISKFKDFEGKYHGGGGGGGVGVEQHKNH